MCFVLLLALLLASCVGSLFESGEQTSTDDLKKALPEGFTTLKLGKKLENPFSLKNMQIALDTLIKLSKKIAQIDPRMPTVEKKDIVLEPTDLYVRFFPKDSVEYDLIRKDTLLNFSDYPLDYEIETEGDFYRDPDLPDDAPYTWQYTVVKPDYQFPNVKYELLDTLFLPENSPYYKEEEDTNVGGVVVPPSMPNKANNILGGLETVSLYLTDNLPEEDKKAIELARKRQETQTYDPSRPQMYRSCWWFFGWHCHDRYRPDGVIKVNDTELGIIPLEGVRVKARWWFYIHTGITDRYGRFSCDGKFSYRFCYYLHWERYDFQVRDGGFAWWGTARYNGDSNAWGPWYATIMDKKQVYYATIFRAAFHYYYKDIKGLKRPPLNGWFKPQMKICGNYKSNGKYNGTHCKDCRLINWFWATIQIYNPSRGSKNTYATVIHELAHASHWELRKDNWHWSTDDIVKESWARGVELELTRMRYSDYNPDYSRLQYTGIVHDMLDGNKNRTCDYYWTESKWVWSVRSYTDLVSGYTIKQIEDVLSYTSSWNSWKINLKNRYNNATKNNLDAAFSYWNTK